MLDVFIARKRIRRMYRAAEDNFYSRAFFSDLCSSYSFVLASKDGDDFYTVEPEDCRLARLIYGGDMEALNRNLEQVIEGAVYDLMVFGKAYIYIDFLSGPFTGKGDKESEILSQVRLVKLRGIVKRRRRQDVLFYRTESGRTVKKTEMKSNHLVELRIKELGYGKRYFVNKMKRLGKCDLTQFPEFMGKGHVDGYDFSVHLEKTKLRKLKALKDIGWLPGPESLSDSFYLYKKIQEYKLRLQFLNYILDKLNSGLGSSIGDADGRLTARVKKNDYDRLWKDYTEGKITGRELTDILFPEV